MRARKAQTADSDRQQPAIFLRDPDAVEVVIERAKKERRSKSAALAVIILEWSAYQSAFRRNRAAARRAKSLPEGNQDTGRCRCGQVENPAVAGETEQPK
jgi:hypothetical protein